MFYNLQSSLSSYYVSVMPLIETCHNISRSSIKFQTFFKALILLHLLFAQMHVSRTFKAHWSFGGGKQRREDGEIKKDKQMTRMRRKWGWGGKWMFGDKEGWEGQGAEPEKKWRTRGETMMVMEGGGGGEQLPCLLDILFSHGRLLLPSANVCLCAWRTCEGMLQIGFCRTNTEHDKNYNGQQW